MVVDVDMLVVAAAAVLSRNMEIEVTGIGVVLEGAVMSLLSQN